MEASHLALFWAWVICGAIVLYTILDGFDLGVGVLFGTTREEAFRVQMMNTIAPFWDGNETWLVVVGAGLFAAFPMVYAVFLSAFYLPVLLLLIGLIFRGIAFEFRFRARHVRVQQAWDRGFSLGAGVVAFTQGAAVGAWIRGIPVVDGQYAGGAFGWLHPFTILTGIGLMLGYALLGAGFLALKNQGELREWAYRRIRWLAAGVLVVLLLACTLTFDYSVVAQSGLHARPWGLVFPVIGLLALGAILVGVRGRRDQLPFVLTVVFFIAAFLTLAVMFWPYMIPYSITVADAAAPRASLQFISYGAIVVLPVILAYTAGVYWIFRGKLRKAEAPSDPRKLNVSELERAHREETEMRRLHEYVILGLGAAAVGAGIGYYLAHPARTEIAGAEARNVALSLDAPAGTLTTEQNPAFKAAATPPAPATAPRAAGDWPSYNKTLTSERFSDLGQINTQNVGKLKVLCTYETKRFTAFETGLLMVEGALIGTTEFDIFSLDPATCAENWRVHEEYPGYLLPTNRGAAYMDGRLYRGTEDGRVLAYDFKTGKRLWETTIGDAKKNEVVPAAPIAWEGLVFIGNAGGDQKGVKGRVYALDGKTGKIVWEFYLVPKSEDDPVRGPQGATPLDGSTWKNPPGIPMSGAGLWTSLSLDPKSGLLYVPGGNPAPDYVNSAREGANLYSDSVVVLDAKTGAYKNHFQLVPHDWHDWDVSSPPVLINTAGGKYLMAVAPKDGFLYGFDLADNKQLYKTAVTKIENADAPFSTDKDTHFCPGAAGGDEWNSPGYNPQTNLIYTGTVDWCTTVRIQTIEDLTAVGPGKFWTGEHTLNPADVFGAFSRADGTWGGWLHAVDADTGEWKWKVRTNYPVIAAVTPTAGGLVFFGDAGGNFYAVDASSGAKLWSQQMKGAMAGGVITYTVNGAQKVAVTMGMTSPAWPVKAATAKIAILGLEGGAP